jgi:hypothetical protein
MKNNIFNIFYALTSIFISTGLNFSIAICSILDLTVGMSFHSQHLLLFHHNLRKEEGRRKRVI